MIDYSEMNYIEDMVVDKFLRYVQIETTSNEQNKPNPTTETQWDLAKLLKNELVELGLKDVEVDEYCYVYAILPASPNVTTEPISFLAHMDTSPAVSGKNIQPLIRKNYQGEDLAYPLNDNLFLKPSECPKLLDYIGEQIITSSGDTLLGADDKAGIAEIMTALHILQENPDILHPELRICFTPDEEVGAGTDNIDIKRLGHIAYTIDGGELGELEDECFDAHSIKITIKGRNVHPGNAKDIMINAVRIASHFVACLPEHESPEHTENREGFYHVRKVTGDETDAVIDIIVRDFDAKKNAHRIDYLESVAETLRVKHPEAVIKVNHSNSYRNMKEVLEKYPEVVNKAEHAMLDLNIKPLKTPIRGGTDGARLCYLGVPTPNIFTGGFLYHSLSEWVPVSSMVAAVKVVVSLANSWAK